MPKVWTEIQIFKARTDRLNCRPRSEKLGCLPPPDRVLQHVVGDSERCVERRGILHHEAARLVGLEEPFVGVQADGVGPLHSAQENSLPFSVTTAKPP